MIELRFVAPNLRCLDEVAAEVVVCGVWQDERPLSGLAGLLDWRLKGRLSKLLQQGFLVGEIGETLLVPVRPRLPFETLLACGLGPRAMFDHQTFRSVLARLLDVLAGVSAKRAVVELPGRGSRTSVNVEQLTTILFELVDDETRDAMCFVEGPEGQAEIESRLVELRKTMLRAARSS